MSIYRSGVPLAAVCSLILASCTTQQEPPVAQKTTVTPAVPAAERTSSYKYSGRGAESRTEITNVNYDVVAEVTPALVLRETARLKLAGDAMTEGITTTEAWQVGVDLSQKPLYSVTVKGEESRAVRSSDGAVFVVSSHFGIPL